MILNHDKFVLIQFDMGNKVYARSVGIVYDFLNLLRS